LACRKQGSANIYLIAAIFWGSRALVGAQSAAVADRAALWQKRRHHAEPR
jgi:hypothetical protein